MMNYNEPKNIIDLSDAVNISDLGIKITTLLDSNSSKELYLNLGSIDLKQSQLLSIKALVEAMQSKIVGIETNSEMTEASAIGLGLSVRKLSKQVSRTVQPSVERDEDVTSSDELNSFAQLKKLNSIGDFVTDSQALQEVETENSEEATREFLAEAESVDYDSEDEPKNIYEAMNSATSENNHIESALDVAFGPRTDDSNEQEEDVFVPITMHESMREHEVTETVEKTEESKYVLLDTEGITPEGLELIKSNTSDLETLYLTQTLRSGQTVSFEGNIFLIGDAHPGSEINATGDITVWGILGGIVHAGSKGNTDAKVRALKLNPIQLRIAHLYSRRNDTVNVPYVQKSNEFTPEEARIEHEQIVIYKTLRREE